VIEKQKVKQFYAKLLGIEKGIIVETKIDIYFVSSKHAGKISKGTRGIVSDIESDGIFVSFVNYSFPIFLKAKDVMIV